MVMMIGNHGDKEPTGRLPSLPGTYGLVLAASAYREVAIGRLGVLALRPGCYVYVGSAMGPGGLAARVGRHCRAEKRLHWHVDYLRAATVLEEVWYATGQSQRECLWANLLHRMPGAAVPMVGFGASDCDCQSHLVFFQTRPSFAAYRDRLRSRVLTRLRLADDNRTTTTTAVAGSARRPPSGGTRR